MLGFVAQPLGTINEVQHLPRKHHLISHNHVYIIKTIDELLDYCNEVLYELKEIDKKENSEYVRTLWLYLKMNNNLVKTAQIMYIHRNTLVNRINKIQAIIGKDINDVKVKMEYLNVFSILEFYGLMGE